MPIHVPTRAGQIPIFKTGEFAGSGFSQNDVKKRIDQELWTRVRKGYLVPYPRGAFHAETWHMIEAHAAIDAQVGDWALSHWSAALIHEIPLWRVLPKPVALSRDSRVARSRKHPRGFHFESRLRANEVCRVGDLLVTTPLRTLVDLCRTCSFEAGVVAIDHCLHESLVQREKLVQAFLTTPQLAGMQRARDALRHARGESESVLESMSRVTFRRGGLPDPELQYVIRDESGLIVARADFYWEAERLVGEADGAGKYRDGAGNGSIRAFEAEKRREQRIRALGFDVIRWTPADLDDPEMLVERIRDRLEMRRRELGR